jgi:predicted ATPase/class 3 adenylate cyclase
MSRPSGTVTLLFTDIEGSTRLWETQPDAMAVALGRHDVLMRGSIEGAGGFVFKTVGDAFCAAFSTAGDALAAATAAQRALAAERWPEPVVVRVRMGLHTGACEERDGDYFGPAVNRAARLAAVAHGGQTLISRSTADLVQDSLPDGVALRDLGEHRLKDLGRPEWVFQVDGAGLGHQFPPLRSLDNPALAHNLPAQSASFVGRDHELVEVRVLVEASRLVTLTGAGGSGKTRLALQVAAELLDGSGDGVWLVELAPVFDERAVASTITEALGITSQTGRPALDTLLDALAPQDILLLLDNCEHLICACAKVADALLRGCPQVHLMTTSREPLGIGGESIYRVPSLSLPAPDDGPDPVPQGSDAVALFLDRAAAQGVDLVLDGETGPLVASICRRLDGMPLAIELAAARLRSLSLADLHDRLDQRFRLLTGGSRSALPRQQTLRATVDWSFSLLNGPEQAVLRRLSVFAEGFDLEAAEAVCGLGDIDLFDITDILGSLVDKSLVVAEAAGGSVRYRLLETIRQFGAEQLVDTGDGEAAEVAAAHCAHFLSVVERAAPHLIGPDPGPLLARLDADQANLRRAIDHAIESEGGTPLVLRFAVGLRRYWWVRSRRAEIVGLFLPVLERSDAGADPGLLGWALVTMALLARTVDIAMTQRLGEQAVAIARRLDDDRLLIESLSVLSAAAYFSGDPGRGVPYGQEAVERARLIGDDFVLGEALRLHLLCNQRMDPQHVEDLFTEAIACAQRSGDQFLIATLRNNAGAQALGAGDLPAARFHLEQAVEAGRSIDLNIHNVTINLGEVLREEGDLDGARSLFEEGLRQCCRNGDRPGIAYASLGLAWIAADEGEWYRAAVLHAVAQSFLDQTGEQWGQWGTDRRQSSIDEVAARLGDDAFQRAWTEGGQLSADKAIDVAIGGVPPA